MRTTQLRSMHLAAQDGGRKLWHFLRRHASLLEARHRLSSLPAERLSVECRSAGTKQAAPSQVDVRLILGLCFGWHRAGLKTLKTLQLARYNAAIAAMRSSPFWWQQACAFVSTMSAATLQPDISTINSAATALKGHTPAYSLICVPPALCCSVTCWLHVEESCCGSRRFQCTWKQQRGAYTWTRSFAACIPFRPRDQ